MRDPRAAQRFRRAVDGVLDRIEESPEQFAEHGLLAVPNGRPLFYLIRRAVLPPPFPYVIFFYVRRGTAIILAIAHGKRQPGYWAARR
jgi:plasmid stabilization system protein ParE